jgi:hypothetical protein
MQGVKKMGESALEVFSALAANASANNMELPIHATPVAQTGTVGEMVDELRTNMARQGAELPYAYNVPLLVSAGGLAVNHF